MGTVFLTARRQATCPPKMLHGICLELTRMDWLRWTSRQLFCWIHKTQVIPCLTRPLMPARTWTSHGILRMKMRMRMRREMHRIIHPVPPPLSVRCGTTTKSTTKKSLPVPLHRYTKTSPMLSLGIVSRTKLSKNTRFIKSHVMITSLIGQRIQGMVGLHSCTTVQMQSFSAATLTETGSFWFGGEVRFMVDENPDSRAIPSILKLSNSDLQLRPCGRLRSLRRETYIKILMVTAVS